MVQLTSFIFGTWDFGFNQISYRCNLKLKVIQSIQKPLNRLSTIFVLWISLTHIISIKIDKIDLSISKCLQFDWFYGDHARAINFEQFKLVVHVCIDNIKLKLNHSWFSKKFYYTKMKNLFQMNFLEYYCIIGATKPKCRGKYVHCLQLLFGNLFGSLNFNYIILHTLKNFLTYMRFRRPLFLLRNKSISNLNRALW